MYKIDKSENGITLVALTIYITIFTMVIGIITTVSTFFYSRIGEVVVNPKYLSEFNKFVMFFSLDIKNYNEATVVENTIKFSDDLVYRYQDNCIYRNDTLIAKNILSCEFNLKTYTVDTVTKNIISVNFKIGKNNKNFIEKSIDFTMKYW